MWRSDFSNIVNNLLEKIRGYDSILHGNLFEFVCGGYDFYLASKGEYVDYSFVMEKSDIGDIKLYEDMLVAVHVFVVAVFELEDCNIETMCSLYDYFEGIGKGRGWDQFEFDKYFLYLMGVEIKDKKPSVFFLDTQEGKDYN
jgi:hypothetical protein